MTDRLLVLYEWVEKIGAPLAIAAWLAVFGGAIALAFPLRRVSLGRAGWTVACVAGGLSLAAHLTDYFLTLSISPDLSLEGNPVWRTAIDLLGLPAAKVYALTGKILLSVLAFELEAWHLHARAKLQPANTDGFAEWMRRFGENEPKLFGVGVLRVACLFAFVFAWIGPYFFYVSALNAVGAYAPDRYSSLPGPVPMIAGWLVGEVIAFFALAFRSSRSLVPSRDLEIRSGA